MGPSSETKNHYSAIEIWLQSHFEDIDTLDLDLSFQIEMRNSRLTLPEVLFVLRTGQVAFSDRQYDGCIFTVVGRNCDEEEISITGGFSSDTQVVSLKSIQKAR